MNTVRIFLHAIPSRQASAMLLLALLLACCDRTVAQVPNDDCETASPITDGAPAAAGFTCGAMDDEVAASCAPEGADVWFVYAATCTGDVRMNTFNGTPFDTVLTAYGACSGNELACNDDANFSAQSELSFPVLQGEPYYISLGGFGSACGPFELAVRCFGDGACCQAHGECTQETPESCQQAGGFFQGLGTDCRFAPCQTGGCCFNQGNDCQSGVIQNVCDELGGQWTPGVDCAGDGGPLDCPTTGACCDASSGTCADTTRAGCASYVCNAHDALTRLNGEAPSADCFGDMNGDGQVLIEDRGYIAANVGLSVDTAMTQDQLDMLCLADLSGDGVVQPLDRGFVSANVGLCTPRPGYQNGSGDDSRFLAGKAFLGLGTECSTSTCPPANDTCDGCEAITSTPFFGPFDITFAGDGDSVGSCAPEGAAANEVWFCYSPDTDCTVRWSLLANFNAFTTVYLDAGGNCRLDEMDCVVDPMGGGAFNAVDGETYYFQISSFGGVALDGTGMFSLECLEEPTGACCLNELGCEAAPDQEACEDIGGQFLGNGTFCEFEQCPCSIDCSASNGEEEHCDSLGSNDGCVAPPGSFGHLSCGESICGNSFTGPGGGDADWFQFVLEDEQQVTLTVRAESTANMGLIKINDCLTFDLGIVGLATTDCTGNSITACLPPGTYAGFVQVAREAECDGEGTGYRIERTCADCQGGACCNGSTCTDSPPFACESQGGAYLGNGTNCSDDAEACSRGGCCLPDGPDLCAVLSADDCDAMGGTYNGGGTDCATTFCPQCEAEDSDCQESGMANDPFGTLATPSFFGGLPVPTFRSADDFKPTQDEMVSSICWNGTYPSGLLPDADNFRISYYADADGRPGDLIASYQDEALTNFRRQRTTRQLVPGVFDYEYTVEHPPVMLSAGACYWIEIVNDLGPDPWLWTTSPVGDLYSLTNRAPGLPYDLVVSANGFDLAFCLHLANGELAEGKAACGAPFGACCLSDGTCQNVDVVFCFNILSGVFQGAGTLCEDNMCGAPGDECETAIEAIDGETVVFLPSAVPTVSEANAGCDFPFGNPEEMCSDLWYEYTAPCTGDLLVDTCLGDNVDTRLAVYWNDCDDLSPRVCNDDNTTFGEPHAGATCEYEYASSLTTRVSSGNSYLIRVGTFFDDFSGCQPPGIDTLNLSCDPDF